MMVWTLFRQQQQRGAQIPRRPGSRRDRMRQQGEAPGEAVADRTAQDHEQAGATPQPGESPASAIENRHQDNTPSAPDPRVQWDEVVQPQHEHGRQQQGETELDQNERGEDAEQTVDPQAEQTLGQLDGREEEQDEDGRLDRND